MIGKSKNLDIFGFQTYYPIAITVRFLLIDIIIRKDIYARHERDDRWKKKMYLSEMKEGQVGIIVRVGGNASFRRRLLEMGFLKGSEVYIEKYAPLKDPIELVIKGYHVSLRVEEASQITVEDVRKGQE